MNGFLVLAAAAALAIAGGVWQRRSTAQHGSWIDRTDPVWLAAVVRARETISMMRSLHDEGREVWVKFALGVAAGKAEHFWGVVLDVSDSSLRARVETRPRAPASTATPNEVTIPLADLEDWQVQMADGSIRGGFTTRAQIEIARRTGRPVPPHIAEMETHLVDR